MVSLTTPPLSTIHRISNRVTQAALLLVFGFFWSGQARAQEEASPSKYYNIKAGPVRVVLTAGVTTEFNDNINLSNGGSSPVVSDISIYPHFGIDAFTEVEVHPTAQTDVTRLGVKLNLGTRQYLQHPELSRDESGLTIAPDSEVALVIKTGYIRTRLYDAFSLEDNPNSDGTLSNVAVFRRFKNIVGFKSTWDVNSKTSLSWGYEHGNQIALDYATVSGTGPNLGSLDNSTDQFSVSGFCQVMPEVGVGWSASALSTSFPDNPEQNMTSYNYGPFTQVRLTQYSSLLASYSRSESEDGSLLDGGGGGGSDNSKTDNYTLTLVNKLNRYYTHNLSLSRQTQFNILGALSVVDRLSYNSVWMINSKISLSSSLFAEEANDLGGGIFANPHYKRYGCSLGTSYRLSRKMFTRIDYQYSKKVSDDADQSYKQNMLTWSLEYAF